MHLTTPSRAAIALLIPFLVGGTIAHAQQRLSLDDAIAATLAQNPRMRAAEASSHEAQDRTAEARAGYMPRIDLVESWQRGNQPVFVFGSLMAQRRFGPANFAPDALNHPAAIDNVRTGLSIAQPIFDGLRTPAAVRAARIGEQLASIGREDLVSALKVATTQAYGQVLMAHAAQVATESAIAFAREDLQRAERRRDVGMGTDADVLSVQVHLAQTRQRLITVISDETVARARLNELMAEALDRQFVLSPAAPLDGPLPNASEAEIAALKMRPDSRRATLQESLAREQSTMARSALLPQASFQGVYEFNGSGVDKQVSSWTVGAEVRWNLFAGGADAARRREARSAAARVSAERQAIETAARVDLRVAIARLEEARARADVAKAAVAGARESQRMIRDRYDAGLASVTDLLRAANAQLDTESLYIAATVDTMVSAAALDRARGR